MESDMIYPESAIKSSKNDGRPAGAVTSETGSAIRCDRINEEIPYVLSLHHIH
jgi:hypothetical protein